MKVFISVYCLSRVAEILQYSVHGYFNNLEAEKGGGCLAGVKRERSMDLRQIT